MSLRTRSDVFSPWIADSTMTSHRGEQILSNATQCIELATVKKPVANPDAFLISDFCSSHGPIAQYWSATCVASEPKRMKKGRSDQINPMAFFRNEGSQALVQIYGLVSQASHRLCSLLSHGSVLRSQGSGLDSRISLRVQSLSRQNL